MRIKYSMKDVKQCHGSRLHGIVIAERRSSFPRVQAFRSGVGSDFPGFALFDVGKCDLVAGFSLRGKRFKDQIATTRHELNKVNG